jgi:hypothetical protein
MRNIIKKSSLIVVVCVLVSIGFVSVGRGVEYTYTELLPPRGWSWVSAYAINNSGAVVGYGFDGANNKGFLYSKGVYTEMLPPGWDTATAVDINDNGTIIGFGNKGDKRMGFIAVLVNN